MTPEPDETTIRRGVALMQRVQPDLLIAIGGGSVLDAGKAMRLFYEHPEKSLDALTMPFLDPRKRVADYPTDRHRIQLVAVPTTSGTGSEVSPAAVLTVGGKKETLVDYSLVPDLAIVDPVLTSSMPQKLTADTGIDALTHARGDRVDLRLALHGCVVRPDGTADLRCPAQGVRRSRRSVRPNEHVQCGDACRPGLLECLRRDQSCPRPRRWCEILGPPWPGERHLPAARAALQRKSAYQVHARAWIFGVHRTG
ncbi:hypothetical protein MPS_2047 [Mycobacterium pseudoshottsii JCM 15466]|nr:Acetaldehyde dehydrogenase / Alcohol dehydrogenase [Mycobacterium pseudoshottsii]GAQ34277.1 hypothetical protein MPS_2047 [Mycobacterium pseudoshottsii JCM 15466]